MDITKSKQWKLDVNVAQTIHESTQRNNDNQLTTLARENRVIWEKRLAGKAIGVITSFKFACKSSPRFRNFLIPRPKFYVPLERSCNLCAGLYYHTAKRLITSQRTRARDTRQNSPASTKITLELWISAELIKVVERLAECIARTKIYVRFLNSFIQQNDKRFALRNLCCKYIFRKYLYAR